jgi:hypothetical protein
MLRASKWPRVNVALIVAALCTGGCATTASVKLDEGRRVGVALVGPNPIVNFPTPGSEAVRAGGATAMGVLYGVYGLLSLTKGLVEGPAIVTESAKRLGCVNSYYQEHPNLAQEIAGVVDRDFSKSVVIESFLTSLAERSNLKVAVVQDKAGIANLTHDEAIRQSTAAGIDTLVELSTTHVDFDYGGELCIVRPSVQLKYRIILVNRDQELAAGNEFGIGFAPESIWGGSKTLTRWLSDRGSLAKEIGVGYAAAVNKIWYDQRGPRFVLPSPASNPTPPSSAPN